MTARALRALAGGLALLAVAAGTAAAAGVAPRTAGAAGGPLRLTIAFTGDVSGYLEPCG